VHRSDDRRDVPAGCDCVVPVEKISVADGVAQLTPEAAPESRSNIHERGTDTRRGDELLQAWYSSRAG
jgi:molybdopterin molybdotransferase